MGSEKNLKIYAILVVMGLLGMNAYGEEYNCEVTENCEEKIGYELKQGDKLLNNGIIKGDSVFLNSNPSNVGLYALGELEDKDSNNKGKINNIGIIRGENYGTYLENIALESFENTGLIEGTEKETQTIRGVNLNNVKITNFNNGGIIKSANKGIALNIDSAIIESLKNSGSLQGGFQGLVINNSIITDFLNEGIIVGGWQDIQITDTTMDNFENIGYIQGFKIGNEDDSSENSSNELDFINKGSISNGTSSFSNVKEVEITNSGTMYDSNRGLNLNSSKINKIENSGMIAGADGVYLEKESTVTDITNSGNLSSVYLKNEGAATLSTEIATINNSGKIGKIELAKDDGEVRLNEVTNTGLITKVETTTLSNENSRIGKIDNYGVVKVVDSKEVGGVTTDHKIEKIETQGITVETDSDGKTETIIVGEAGQKVTIAEEEYLIINGTTNGELSEDKEEGSFTTSVKLYTEASVLNNEKYLIINGLSKWNSGALIVDKELHLTNSIINDGGDGSAVLLEGNKFTGSNIIINGGKQGAIKGGADGDIVNLDTNTIVNGDINLGNGENTLTIDNSIVNGDINLGTDGDTVEMKNGTTINGEIKMGEGEDTLTLDGTVTVNMNLDYSETTNVESVLDGGEGIDILNLGSENENLNVLYTIANFETININGNVTLFESVEEGKYTSGEKVSIEASKITGAENIVIGSGNLTLRVDSTKRNEEDQIIGHALYENEGLITSSEDGNGKLMIGLNGLGKDSIIDMGGTIIHESLDSETTLLTNSLVLEAELINEGTEILIESNDVLITVREELPIPPDNIPNETNKKVYEKQNSVYKSIVSAGEIGKLAETTLIDPTGDYYTEVADKQEQLLSLLDQIYANSPYAYTLKTTREGMKTVEENMSYLTIKPKADKWLTQGKGFYTNSHSDNKADSKNYHGYDQIGTSRNYDTSTYSKGGLATFEYGLTDISSIGFVFAGYDQNIDLSGASEMKSDSIYLGGYLKKEFGNIRLMGGIGGQYTSSNGERVIANESQMLRTVGNYSSNSLSAYIEGRYDYQLNETISIRPKARLSGYMVKQGDVNEGYSADTLSIQVDKEKAFTGEAELGFDIVKESYKKSGKLKSTLSLSGIYAKGDGENEELTGRVTGTEKLGSDFGIEGAEIPEYSGKVSYDLEYEKYNGKIFTIGVSYEVSDIDNNLNMSIGYGYKF